MDNGQSCWQFFHCFKVLCQVYGKSDIDCWKMPQTHCCNYIFDDFFEKISVCLSCAYFKKKGAQHPKGMQFFIAEQLRSCNQKAFEQQFQKEESFIQILNRIPDGLFTFDRDWRINYFNPAAEQITGFYAEDAVGMYCEDVFKLARKGKPLRKTIADGLAVHNQEELIIDIDGNVIPVICSTSAFRNKEGEVLGGLEIFKDIREIKILQQEVVKREKKYRRIFEGSHDMIYISNQEGKLLDVNKAGVEMLGFSCKNDLLALASARQLYVNPDDREKVVARLNRDGSAKDMEIDFSRADGRSIHGLLSSRQYQDPRTGEIQYEGLIKDITRRKETEELIRKRNRELSILNSIAVTINHTTGLHNILHVTLKRVLTVFTLSRGGIFLLNRKERNTQVGANKKLVGLEQGAAVRLIFRDQLLQEFLINSAPALMPESSFPSFWAGYEPRGDQALQWLSCHLIISKDIPVGFFGFVLPPGKIMDQHELRLLGSLGNFLGNAIENARMVETIEHNRKNLQRLTQQLFQSQEEERRRIAQELHDEAGQSLTAVKLGLDNLEQKLSDKDQGAFNVLSATRKMLVRTSTEIRRLAYHLHPTLLTDLGLEPALKLYFKDIEAHSGLSIEFQMIGFDGRLDRDMETALYRFSQEAMTNTLKHSGAEVFKLKIIKGFPKLIFIAEDDGVGFEEQLITADKKSLGLLGMRERAQLLGGKFFIKGRPGLGVRIRIEIQMPADDDTVTKGLIGNERKN